MAAKAHSKDYGAHHQDEADCHPALPSPLLGLSSEPCSAAHEHQDGHSYGDDRHLGKEYHRGEGSSLSGIGASLEVRNGPEVWGAQSDPCGHGTARDKEEREGEPSDPRHHWNACIIWEKIAGPITAKIASSIPTMGTTLSFSARTTAISLAWIC